MQKLLHCFLATLLAVLFTMSLGSFASFALAADNKLNVVILGEFSGNAIDVTELEPRLILNMLNKQSEKGIRFNQQQVSLSRSWFELNKQANNCLYNKMQTIDRQQTAVYSRYPVSLYPPLKLIVLTKNAKKFNSPIDLSRTVMSHNQAIGAVDGRAYGSVIDRIIQQKTDSFFIRQGDDSAAKLIDMLALERVLGVIEYQHVAVSYFKKQYPDLSITAIPIKYVIQPTAGYFVCSKNTQGNEIIAEIDKVMSTKLFQDEFINIHNDFFHGQDKVMLTNELNKIFAR